MCVDACGLRRLPLFVPFSTDANPTSHRVRLWRGGSASKVPLHRPFFRRVHPHGHPQVCNGPWLLQWSRGGRRDSAAGGHRSFCDPVCCQSAPCILLFSPLKNVCKNLPGWPAALAAGAPRAQLRTWYAAWVEWVASERKEPSVGGCSIVDSPLFLVCAGRSCVDLLLVWQVHALHRLCGHGQLHF